MLQIWRKVGNVTEPPEDRMAMTGRCQVAGRGRTRGEYPGTPALRWPTGSGPRRHARETRRSWEKTSRSVLCAGRACQQDLGVPPIACHPLFPTYTEFHAPNVRYFVRAIPWQSLAVRGTPCEAMREKPLREIVTDRGNMQAVQTLAGEQSANCDARILSPLHHVCFQWLSLAVRRTCARQVRLGQAFRARDVARRGASHPLRVG